MFIVSNGSGWTDQYDLVAQSFALAEVPLPVGENLIQRNRRIGSGRTGKSNQARLKRLTEIDRPQLHRGSQGEGGRRRVFLPGAVLLPSIVPRWPGIARCESRR